MKVRCGGVPTVNQESSLRQQLLQIVQNDQGFLGVCECLFDGLLAGAAELGPNGRFEAAEIANLRQIEPTPRTGVIVVDSACE